MQPLSYLHETKSGYYIIQWFSYSLVDEAEYDAQMGQGRCTHDIGPEDKGQQETRADAVMTNV